jgi:hypothetical protein
VTHEEFEARLEIHPFQVEQKHMRLKFVTVAQQRKEVPMKHFMFGMLFGSTVTGTVVWAGS